LLNKTGDRINFHPLCAPAEHTIGWRVATSDDVDPEGLLGRWADKMGLDVEISVSGALSHLRQRRLDHFYNGRYFNARVRAYGGDLFLPLLLWNGANCFEDELCDERAVLSSAESNKPRT
jgi:hypothetical protein